LIYNQLLEFSIKEKKVFLCFKIYDVQYQKHPNNKTKLLMIIKICIPLYVSSFFKIVVVIKSKKNKIIKLKNEKLEGNNYKLYFL
jgi:hypothetical protein